MAKQYKIKRYHRTDNVYKAKPHPVVVALWILGLGALVFVGISIYQPVYNFIMGDNSFFHKQQPQISLDSQSQQDTPSQTPEQLQPVVQDSVSADTLRTVWLPGTTAANPQALDGFLTGLEGTDINAVMVDIKDAEGTVLFGSTNPDAAAWGALSPNTLDLPAISKQLGEKGINLVVRMSAFSDKKAAKGNRENAIHFQDSEWLWLDNDENAGGKPWLNPFSPGAQNYITNLAVEAVNAGAAMVVLENVQFPDGSSSANANFGVESDSQQRGEILKTFVQQCSAAVEEAGGHLAVYLPIEDIALGAVVGGQTNPNTYAKQVVVRYGKNPLDMVGDIVVVGVLPYVMGNDFNKGGLIIPRPMEDPAATAKTVLEYVKAQLGGKECSIVPLLQGGSEASPMAPLNKQQLDNQLVLVKESGSMSYILYTTSGSYLLQ